mmetsp:Transcript_10196/g.18361  ORF Transcript_10196/g.18361 Transcript_10196/m.18361 type:complete len:92 (+) Transcript_10196:80-355(+)
MAGVKWRAYRALVLTLGSTIGIVAYVHYDQKSQLRRMQEGIVRDAERDAYRQSMEHSNLNSASSALDHQSKLDACEVCQLKPDRTQLNQTQ